MKSKTEINFVRGANEFFDSLKKWNIDSTNSIVFMNPVSMKTLNNPSAARKMSKNNDKFFIIIGDKENDWKSKVTKTKRILMSMGVKEEQVIDTIQSAPDNYTIELFFNDHVSKQNVYDFTNSDSHKNQTNIFSFVWKKYHLNVLKKAKADVFLTELEKVCCQKEYGMHKFYFEIMKGAKNET